MSEPTKTSWLTVQNLKDGGLAALLIAAIGALIDGGCRELPTPAPAPQPSPVGPVDPVIERWYVTRGGEVLEAPEVIAVAEALEAGQYELVGYPRSGKIRRVGVGIVDNAPAPLPPAPVPPGPTPPNPTPVPPTPPEPKEGKRHIIIVRESADQGPWLGGLIVSLRSKPHITDWLKAKGHKLYVLDDDDTRPDALPWLEKAKGKQLPLILICDAEGDGGAKVLHEKTIATGTTYMQIQELVRQHGG